MSRTRAAALAAALALAAGFAGVPAAALAADAARGSVLYEARCKACHDVSVHSRRARKAGSFVALREQVRRWSAEVGGRWSAREIDDLTMYLNERYYHFKCPRSVCKANQAAAG